MEKRVIIFLVLSLALILGYDYVLRQLGMTPPSPPPAEAPEQSSEQAASKPDSAGSDVPALGQKPETQAQVESGQAPRKPRAETVQAATDERLEQVSTDLIEAVFTTRGAQIRNWKLKRYSDGAKENPRPIDLAHQPGSVRGPLSLYGSDSEQNKETLEGLYRVERDFSALDASHPVGHLTFTYQDSAGKLRVEKELTFHHDSYLVDVRVRTTGLRGPVDVSLGTNFGIVEWGEGFIGLIGPASMVDGTIDKDVPAAEAERKGAVQWVALQDKYFLSVLIPRSARSADEKGASRAQGELDRNVTDSSPKALGAVVKKEGDKLVSAGVRADTTAPADLSLQLYAGPKQFDTLKALNIGLEDTIDFGWFIYGSWGIVKAVAKPLYLILRFLYEYTHNYGVTIILLTVAIKLLFVPLQYKSYKSMKDMQSIQPKVVALQAKYKDDRERLNRELIKLYKDHKVNPVGGCLPMLLQMPVFVSLFNILYMTIDLRQAPFILWITDLSAQDPYYVLPVLMGVSMVIQQKIMPSTMDPTQAKIMLLLPAFMTVLFLTFPSGLVLYWLTNNVLTIGQQFITDRYVFKRPLLSSLSSGESASPAPGSQATEDDGQKSGGKKKKDKTEQKSETNTPIEG
jgi:YidC/Oxa1 family membrane protein insertase